jgi:hypothetical protein
MGDRGTARSALPEPLVSSGPDGYHPAVFFQIVGEISKVQAIAVGRQIQELARLKKLVWAGSLAQDEG